MRIKACLLVGAKDCTNTLSRGLHDRLMTGDALIVREALIAKSLMLRTRLREDLTHRGGLRGIQIQVLLHARDACFWVHAACATVTTTMLALASCRRLLCGSDQGRAQRKRGNGEEHGDAIAGVHGFLSFCSEPLLDDGTLQHAPCANLKCASRHGSSRFELPLHELLVDAVLGHERIVRA